MRPVPGAQVRLVAPTLELGDPEDHSEPTRWYTDEEGQSVLAGIPSGRHVVRVEADGFLVGRLELPFEYARLEALPHLREGSTVIRLTPRGALLVGRAIDPEGRAVSGALVCLDTRSARGRFRRELPWNARQAPPFALTDAAGRFQLAVPPAVAGAALLVCPGRSDLVPVLRVEMPSSDAGNERVVRIPRASAVVLRVLQPDGRPALGRIAVGDGELAFDLASDPLLTRIPGFEQTFAPRQQPGELELALPDGGYTVLFQPVQDGSAPRSFYVRVPGVGGRRIDLQVDP